MTSDTVHLHTTTPASTQDYAVCRNIMRGASKNYSFASTFLPSDRLHHVEALYAFLRVGDDRVDVSHEGFASPEEAIDDWEASYYHGFTTGGSNHPVIRAYVTTARECGIPQNVMTDYFRAMREDVTRTQYETYRDLVHYMKGSAVPVGRAMTHILGVRKPYTFTEALPLADSLAEAMQLTNFLRDVGEDRDMDRVYLPKEDMDRFGYSSDDLADGNITHEFIDLMEFQMERAEALYARARVGVNMLNTGRWGIMSGLEVYRGILNGIRRNGYDVFTRRAGSSRLRKLLLVTSAFIRVMRSNRGLTQTAVSTSYGEGESC